MCSKLDGKVPDASGVRLDFIDALNSDIGPICDTYVEQLEGIKIRAAIATAMEASAKGNKFLQVRRAPAFALSLHSVACLQPATFSETQ